MSTKRKDTEYSKLFNFQFGGNPVSCAVGLAVMDVIQNEQLLSSAKCVGKLLLEGFHNIKSKHPMMGDVRGMGLVLGIELVTDKESRKPASEAAELLTYK
jgi:4-aminobutyrate aminotransferase-like enzyme